jgi:hypothetical protein
MKTETLDALLIDRELGELPPEVIELLDTYLKSEPAACRRADAMVRTVGTARETVRRFPELARATEMQSPENVVSLAQWLAPWLVRAAVAAAVAVLCSWLGYRAGMNSVPAGSARLNQTPSPQRVASQRGTADTKNLWTRYDVGFDPRRGTFTIAAQPSTGTLQ